jgi:Mrp family chromosome partitioning ATPase
MERLQIAVEKARAKRRSADQAADATPTPVAAAAATASAAPVAPLALSPAPPAVSATAPDSTPAPNDTDAVAQAWQALRPLETSVRAFRRNRLVSFEGGPAAGPYDLLRTKIIQQARTNNWHRIAVVSPHAACGKTTTTANLAFSFARQKDLRTLFIDLDLRRPALAKVMGRTARFNMADVLEGRVSFADHAERYGDNVAFGFNNDPVRNSSEILQSQQTQDVLARIETVYGADLMIFDMPPMLASDDNFGFLKNVDCALLVVAAEQTLIHQIDVVERQLAELTSVMGVVLNKCNYTDGAYGYDYGKY